MNLCNAEQVEACGSPREASHERNAPPQGRGPGANLKTDFAMDLAVLARECPQVSITIHAADLLEFGRRIATDTMTAARKDEAERIRAEQATELISSEDAVALLGVTKASLWRWRKRGYIEAVNVGGRIKYRRADCLKIMAKNPA